MYYIGIDIGGMSIKGGIVDEKGTIYLKRSVVTQPHAHYDVIVGDIVGLIRSLADEFGITLGELGGIGIGIPGTIDPDKGTIVYSNNIDFENVPIVEAIQKQIDLPVKIGNDANCAALGEVKFGSGKGMNDIVFVTLGTGVGTGIIREGKILSFKGGAGGEGGHMSIRVDGERCTCGRRGCWEAYASATALIRQTKRAMERHPDSLMHRFAEEEGKVSGRTAFLAARAGDAAGLAVVNRYVKYVAEGLINLVNIFRPEALLIGGGVSNEGEYFIRKLQSRVTRFSYGGKRNPYVKVLKAELMNDAGLLGAVALCL